MLSLSLQAYDFSRGAAWQLPGAAGAIPDYVGKTLQVTKSLLLDCKRLDLANCMEYRQNPGFVKEKSFHRKKEGRVHQKFPPGDTIFEAVDSSRSGKLLLFFPFFPPSHYRLDLWADSSSRRLQDKGGVSSVLIRQRRVFARQPGCPEIVSHILRTCHLSVRKGRLISDKASNPCIR